MLVDFLATIRSFSNFTGEHPRTGQAVKMRVLELRSQDPECKLRTISVPFENCKDLMPGRKLRVTVEVVD